MNIPKIKDQVELGELMQFKEILSDLATYSTSHILKRLYEFLNLGQITDLGLILPNEIDNETNTVLTFLSKYGLLESNKIRSALHDGKRSAYTLGNVNLIKNILKTKLETATAEELYRLEQIIDRLFTIQRRESKERKESTAFLSYKDTAFYLLIIAKAFQQSDLEIIDTDLKNYFVKFRKYSYELNSNRINFLIAKLNTDGIVVGDSIDNLTITSDGQLVFNYLLRLIANIKSTSASELDPSIYELKQSLGLLYSEEA